MKVSAVSTIFSTFGCLCLLHYCVVWGEAKPVPAQKLIVVEFFKLESHNRVGNVYESRLKKCENFKIGNFTHVAFSVKLVKDPCVCLCDKPCGSTGEICVELRSARNVLYPLTLLGNQVKSISRCRLKNDNKSKQTVNDYYDTKDKDNERWY